MPPGPGSRPGRRRRGRARLRPAAAASCGPGRRRARGAAAAAGAEAGGSGSGAGSGAAAGRTYVNFTGFPFPLAPFTRRRTVRREVEPGRVWCFEQEQGIGLGLGVSNLTRMTVVKLKGGGLFVYAPIAPTKECVALVRELGAPVQYIVLPTTLVEHKIFVGPFARRFPAAEVYAVPDQWAWPVDLPPPLLGIFPAAYLREGDAYPWDDELDFRLCRPPRPIVFYAYRYCEAAFFHRPTRTLLVCDAVVHVPAEPPAVLPRALLARAADDGNFLLRTLERLDFKGFRQLKADGEAAEAGEEAEGEGALRRGWARMVLFSLFIAPDPASVLDPAPAFKSLQGRWIVGPVVYALVYQNIPTAVAEWVESLAQWPFRRIIPCHFAGPVAAAPADLKAAFAWANPRWAAPPPGPPGPLRLAAQWSASLRALVDAAVARPDPAAAAEPEQERERERAGEEAYLRGGVPAADFAALRAVGRAVRRLDAAVYGRPV